MASRTYDFDSKVFWEVWVRQSGACAHCGNNLRDNNVECLHHVVPNQAGDKSGPTAHRFLATADNAVLLCNYCHEEEAHPDGNYRHGAMPDLDWYENSHGTDPTRHKHHLAWRKKMKGLIKTSGVWPKY